MKRIRTRFAPSPTGSLHIGGLRTAVYSYALAKHKKGDFILRIEDTDKKREVPGAREGLEKILKVFGLKWDEYYIQSQRAEQGIYKKEAEKLIKDGHAFYCRCSAREVESKGFSKVLRDPCRDKRLTSGAIKLKVPEGETVSYKDFVLRKEIAWNTSDVADTTLLKSNGFPTYHLAVVVDDSEMSITHVLRGHDWLPSTPIHLLIYKYLGNSLPEIGHLTDILDPAGGKLSKRKGSFSCDEFLNQGYLPEAILNFVILLGWAPKDNREIFTLSEFVENFDIRGLQKSNPVFNKEKLDWFNGYYIRHKSDEELAKVIYPFAPKDADKKLVREVVPLIKERIKKLSDFRILAGFFFKRPKVDRKLMGKNWKRHLTKAYEVIDNLKSWRLEELNGSLIREIEKNNFKTGEFFMDLRIAITGSRFTPPINESVIILGKEETLKRLKNLLV